MNQITYIKLVNLPVLTSELSSLSIGSLIESVTTVGNLITITTSKPLSLQEHKVIYNAITKHNPGAKVIEAKLDAAASYGAAVIRTFTVENVVMGITQAGKAGEVSDYLHNLVHYVGTGSLYQAQHEIDRLVASGIPDSLSPFVTASRLLKYKDELNKFLGN
jgi:hypothetical protein